PYPQKALRSLFYSICKDAGLDLIGRQISNHSGRKTSVQVLKELECSDAVVMSITRHKTQQGLAAYERPKTVMQQQGISGFLDAIKIRQTNDHKDDYNKSYQNASNQGNNSNMHNLTLTNSFVNAKSLLPQQAVNQQESASQTNSSSEYDQQKILNESSSVNIPITEPNHVNDTSTQNRNEILNEFLRGNFQN
ncbi:2749_t:CDS:2, partial [Gigaspora rosea]